MTAFLNHLVGIALGQTSSSAARLSLPSRFAQPSTVVNAAPDGYQATGEQPAGSPIERMNGPITNPLSSNRNGDAGLAVAPAGNIAEKSVGEARYSAEIRPLREPGTEPSIKGPQVWPPLETANAFEGRPVAATEHFEVTPRAAKLWPHDAMPSPDVLSGLERRAAPLSDAAMAGRINACDQDHPVVHVTIDRLEVRAASRPKPVAAERPARPAPAVSLADYLRGSGSGGKA